MSSYPDKFPRDSFTSHINITHEPSRFKFYQQAGRIVVLKEREFDGTWGIFASFTNTPLQKEGTVLTEAQLIRSAISWLQDNWKG